MSAREHLEAFVIVRVGSMNPVKLGAIREVMAGVFPEAVFVPVAVPSEVPDQPLGLEETLRGARNRAKNAFADCFLSVALESGPAWWWRMDWNSTRQCARPG